MRIEQLATVEYFMNTARRLSSLRVAVWVCGCARSLGSRVIELVLSGAAEAALHPAVSPQSADHVGQVVWEDSLLFRCGRQRKELPCIILRTQTRTQQIIGLLEG